MKIIKIKIKKTKDKKAKIKDFIFNITMVKADIFWVKEKKLIIFINKDDIRIFSFFNLKDFIFINIFV